MVRRLAGCDLGKASACFAIVEVEEGARPRLLSTRHVVHEGRPFEALREWYRDEDVAECAALGSTGLYAAELVEPVVRFPEDASQAAALDLEEGLPESMNLVSVGARGYGVLTRAPGPDGRPQVRYVENDKCSSGTGDNIHRTAHRFGLSVAEADRLAAGASTAIPITARCSVFSKSEMTHHANQGRPTDELFAGFFTSIARNTRALLERNRVEGPTWLVGGCARSEALREALGRLLPEGEVRTLQHSLELEAIGAALLVAEAPPTSLPADPTELIRHERERFRVLSPASASRERVTRLVADPPSDDWTGRPAVLGLDLGSTGAKAGLTDMRTGELLADVYDRTQGNPVDASRRLIRALLDRGTPDVRAIGVTGSGREAVATLLRAVFPAATERLVVLNEIVAHATAAIRCDPEGGRDLTVVEIGGQDAKYIRVSGGRIIESDLNKACSAGTGSFLEEQATFYDVHEIEEFVRLAREAIRPPDLGQMCTVYVADAGAEALKDGFSLADIFAGFQYSVIHNYLDRVMGQRRLAETVFFQGKPASNPSLAWTLAAVTGHQVTVPPNPGAMGAWGIGLGTIEHLGEGSLERAAPFELGAVLEADVAERTEFLCKDKRCATMCPIERTTIRVGDESRVALSGGACPKYEVAAAGRAKLPVEAPDPFAERRALLDDLAPTPSTNPDIAVPVTGGIAAVLPWIATFLRHLGFSTRVLWSDAGTLAAGELLCNSFDSCGPTKIAHALCDRADAPLLFFPKILDLADAQGLGGQTCVTEQAMPELAEQGLIARGKATQVIRPVLSFAGGCDLAALADQIPTLSRLLDRGPEQVEAAIDAAATAQEAFERALLEAGDRALEWARSHDVPVVLLCGNLHVIHDVAIDADLPHLLRREGTLALPVDCLRVPRSVPVLEKVYWADSNRFLRAALAARDARDVFPVFLGSFGCGPTGFTEQVFQSFLEGYPHTVLETDGHGGAAGYVTRLQAFLYSVRQFRGEHEPELPSVSHRIDYVRSGRHKGSYLDRDVRYLFLSGPDMLGDVFAAVYRSYGYDAVAAPPLSHEGLTLGRRDCSGKECLSYQMMWGAFRQHLEAHPPDRETRLMQITGQQCRAGVFPAKDRITLEKHGWDDQVVVSALKIAGGVGMTLRAWTALTVADLLRQLYVYHLGVDGGSGEVDRLYRAGCDRLIAVVEARVPDGKLATARQLTAGWRRLRALVDEISADYAGLDEGDGGFRTLFVSGDLLTKANDHANGGLYHYLASQGVRAVVEPSCDFLEFLGRAQPHLLFGRNSTPRRNRTFLAAQVAIRDRLYRTARRHHPWLPVPDIPAALARGHHVLDNATNGGAVLAVGSVLHHWERGGFDGVLLTSCWGCDNGLIEESLLRHQRQIPTFFFYDDATPIDTRRIDSFVFGLGRAS